MRKTGIALILLAYAVLLYTTLAAPAYAHAHPQLDPAMLAQYAGPWPVARGARLLHSFGRNCLGVDSDSPGRSLGAMDVLRDAPDLVSGAPRQRPALPRRSGSSPARLPHLHDRDRARCERAGVGARAEKCLVEFAFHN